MNTSKAMWDQGRRIRDMPQEMRPREKLFYHGTSSLSDAELIALLLSSGVKGRSAIEIGGDLLRTYGSIGALGALPLGELSGRKGLGLAKASKLAAAFELGSRMAKEKVSSAVLDSPEAIRTHFAPQMAHMPQEQVWVAVVDVRLRHVSTDVVSVGTVNESSAHPREILRPVITRAGYGFILLHNHPSGDPSPSRADEVVTRRLADASALFQIRFVDHVIIGRPGNGRQAYFSFRESGQLG